jgi:predicted transcriptional regulator
MKFIETSAKTSKNVDESFKTMTKEIIDIMVEKEKTIKKKPDSNSNKFDLSKKSTKLIDNSGK